MAPPPLYGVHVFPKFMAVTLNLARAAQCLMGNSWDFDRGLKRYMLTKKPFNTDIESMFCEKSNA